MIKLRSFLKNNIFMIIVILVSSILLFGNLGNSYAPIDEANTMILGENTMKYGYPKVWDGEYLVSPFFEGDITSDKVWVSHPWLQFYVTAISFKIFGKTTLAARIPYALAGLLSIIAIYFLAEILSGSKKFAKISMLLLAFNVSFLVYSRQSRYYALTCLFTILTMYMFFAWLKDKRTGHLALFIISSALLFHSYYPFWVFLTLVIGLYGSILFLKGKQYKLLIKFIGSHIILGIITLTWFLYAKPHAPLDTGPEFNTWIKNFTIYFWKLNSWLVPIYTLGIIYLVFRIFTKAKRSQLSDSGAHVDTRYFVFLSVPLYIGFISVIPILTTQYAMPVIPVLILIASFFIYNIYQYNRWIGVLILTICLTTNIWNIFPYLLVEKMGIEGETIETVLPNSRCDFVEGASLEHYLKDEMVIRSYLADHIKSLFHDYDNRIEGIVKYLNENGEKSQTVLSFWADANAIRFYTGMNVIYEFFPLYSSPEIENLVHKQNTQIDWIIFDTLDFYPVNSPFYQFDPDDYELVEIPYPKEYHDNVPNIDFFEFLTNQDAPQSFYILKNKSIAE